MTSTSLTTTVFPVPSTDVVKRVVSRPVGVGVMVEMVALPNVDMELALTYSVIFPLTTVVTPPHSSTLSLRTSVVTAVGFVPVTTVVVNSVLVHPAGVVLGGSVAFGFMLERLLGIVSGGRVNGNCASQLERSDNTAGSL